MSIICPFSTKLLIYIAVIASLLQRCGLDATNDYYYIVHLATFFMIVLLTTQLWKIVWATVFVNKKIIHRGYFSGCQSSGSDMAVLSSLMFIVNIYFICKMKHGHCFTFAHCSFSLVIISQYLVLWHFFVLAPLLSIWNCVFFLFLDHSLWHGHLMSVICFN